MSANILIADDHDIFRLGLKLLLLETGFNVDEARNEKEFFSCIQKNKYQLIVLDYYMPNSTGEALYLSLQKNNVSSHIIFLTSLNDPQIISRLLSFNIQGLMRKSSSLSHIKRGIISAMKGHVFIDESVFTLIENAPLLTHEETGLAADFQLLTSRELEIIQLVADGLINKEIGDKLNISKRTVEVHRSNILNKISLKSFYAVVVMAYRMGIIK